MCGSRQDDPAYLSMQEAGVAALAHVLMEYDAGRIVVEPEPGMAVPPGGKPTRFHRAWADAILAALAADLPDEPAPVRGRVGRRSRRTQGEAMTGSLDARLTPRARNVLMCAGLEAERLGHKYVGTEHILLGLLREGEGIGAGVLEKMGVRLEQAREEVESIVGRETP